MDHPARHLTPNPTRRAAMALVAPALMALAAGCATGPDARPDRADGPLQRALEQGDCREAYPLVMPDADGAAMPGEVDMDSRLQVAHGCLQQGEFERARDLSDAIERVHGDHPDLDYAAYLGSLARLGIWNRATAAPPRERIRHGREVFRHLAGFMEQHAMSRHAESLAPRLARLREDLAGIELQLAESTAERNEDDEAHARLRYIRDHFPGTDAARIAAERLEDSDRGQASTRN
ncbi:outer membrane protein assembly factor BamD [Thioalkalivibrio sp. ALE11]|uniref:outer membrane protein assembly factor BamD n=1 Tax=Thioalkalivibrio sp. ALE11 TaxID=1265494 RepID=UPI00035DFD88|nr:outer membrane protein assembly factor BamD [Thioalkalivibrio sp. ALE11]